MIRKYNPFYRFMFVTCIFISSTTSASAEIIFSDFEFGSGTPFIGTATIGDTVVELTTTNTQPIGTSSFRDNVGSSLATVTFKFSVPIAEFVLTVSRVQPPGEFLTDFNIGTPTSLTGDLVDIEGNITSSQPGDFGTGSLEWTGINTSVVSFTIRTDPAITSSGALEVDEFGFGISTSTSCAIGTVSSILDIHMPSLNYQSSTGTQNMWIDFEFYGQGLNGEFLWMLTDYGLLTSPASTEERK